jgi:hypothetical protein
LLLYESRFNLRFVNRSIDFIEFLEEKAGFAVEEEKNAKK